MKLIGLYSSVPQSGKSTFAARLMEAHKAVRGSFALPVKDTLAVFLSHITGTPWFVEDINRRKAEEIPQLGKTVRELLQTLGTDWGRVLVHPDVWVACGESTVIRHSKSASLMVFDDLRFRNEAEMIRRRGGVTVKIIRPGWIPPDSHQGIKGHASEGGLEDWDFDEELAIAEGLAAIKTAADKFVSKLMGGK